MKIMIDGKCMKADCVKIFTKVPPVCGITEDDSSLEITISDEGVIADLWEITDGCTGSSCECTQTFGNTFDEFVELLK